MGMDSFAPGLKKCTAFVVKNISPQNKCINIFNNPINLGATRDLLQIRGVAEDDIRASLLKGEIKHKFECEDIELVFSDIDLLQFSSCQRNLLKSWGFTTGLQVTSSELSIIKYEDVELIGDVDGTNVIFQIPSGTFIENPPLYKIIVYLNGVKQFYLDDYLIAESGGVGTGYDTIVMIDAPEATPSPPDIITADYFIDNS